MKKRNDNKFEKSMLSGENIVWRDITEIDKYEISNTGIVRNKKRGNIIKQITKNRNYPTVALSKNGKCVQRFIHRLVALEYVENDDKEENTKVHHRDENKMNYRVDNLVWSTQYKNIQDYMERHKGDTNIEHMKKTLCSPIIQIDMDGNKIAEFNTPAGSGYHCKEFYKCMKNHIPFRGSIFLYKSECNEINIRKIIGEYLNLCSAHESSINLKIDISNN